MNFIKTALPDVVIIEPKIFGDERGWFLESFKEPTFFKGLRELGCPLPKPFVQDNHSCSKKGVLRGLHFQHAPRAQGKLVRVVRGAAWDVAVDIRKGSPTYGAWVGEELSAENGRMMWIPEGFAHGFLALQEDTHFLYKTTDVYSKEHEDSLAWNDPDIAIEWPEVEQVFVSDKDSNALPFCQFHGMVLTDRESSSEPFDLKVIGDVRGSLISVESLKSVPFEIRRVYYIYGTQIDVSRGYHAHRDLLQLAVCVSGSCRIRVNDGKSWMDYLLDSPEKGVLIKNLVWREMHDFSNDCVLMVLASGHYDESDYIRNYEEFLKEVRDAER